MFAGEKKLPETPYSFAITLLVSKPRPAKSSGMRNCRDAVSTVNVTGACASTAPAKMHQELTTLHVRNFMIGLLNRFLRPAVRLVRMLRGHAGLSRLHSLPAWARKIRRIATDAAMVFSTSHSCVAAVKIVCDLHRRKVYALRCFIVPRKLLEEELPVELPDAARTVVRGVSGNRAPAACESLVLRLCVVGQSRIV